MWVRRFFEVMGWTGGKGLFVCLLAWLLERGLYRAVLEVDFELWWGV